MVALVHCRPVALAVACLPAGRPGGRLPAGRSPACRPVADAGGPGAERQWSRLRSVRKQFLFFMI